MKILNLNEIIIVVALFSFCSCIKSEDPIPPIDENDTTTELYYYSKRDGVNNIYKSDLQGNETNIISDEGHHDWWVRLSPDKSKMLWYKSPLDVPANKEYNNYKEAELWMANSNGSNARKMIDLKDYNWLAQGVADWSPDGTELVMAVIDETGHWHIYITNSDGTNPTKISRRNSLYADPSWSPDGKKIVYSAFPEGYVGINFFKLEIHTMNRDGSNEVQLTNDEWRDHDPYWSPDGKEIAFESQWNLLHCLIGKWAIRKYNFDTQQTTNLLKDNNANGLPRWTKDSEKIFFGRTECGVYGKLMQVNRDGSDMRTVLSSSSFPYYDCDVKE